MERPYNTSLLCLSPAAGGCSMSIVRRYEDLPHSFADIVSLCEAERLPPATSFSLPCLELSFRPSRRVPAVLGRPVATMPSAPCSGHALRPPSPLRLPVSFPPVSLPMRCSVLISGEHLASLFAAFRRWLVFYISQVWRPLSAFLRRWRGARSSAPSSLASLGVFPCRHFLPFQRFPDASTRMLAYSPPLR